MKTLLISFLAILLAAASEPAMASDCHAIGAAKAKQQGGQLAKATPQTVNGQKVCIVVVLVPGKNGQRPRREQYVIPH